MPIDDWRNPKPRVYQKNGRIIHEAVYAERHGGE